VTISRFPLPTNTRRSANLRRQAKEREAAKAVLRDLRKQARDEIDRLLEFLDASDLDPDLEPALGFPEANIRQGGGSIYGPSYTSQGDQGQIKIEDGRCGATDDREADDGDLEPSLCGVTAHGLSTPRHCPITGASPIEDGEQDAEDEPSLGSGAVHEHASQEHWATAGTRDLEDEDDEASLIWTD
jgi:hypothetical protein